MIPDFRPYALRGLAAFSLAGFALAGLPAIAQEAPPADSTATGKIPAIQAPAMPAGAAAASLTPPAASPAAQDSAYEFGKTTILGRPRALTRKESEFVARMPLKNLDNPQSYQVVPKELAVQQLVTDYNGFYKNIPGASVDEQWMQGSSQFYTRGFVSTPDVRNGLSLHVVTDMDPVNVERLEAIRGPAGALFGAGNGISYGGLFNTVTKTPYKSFGGEVSVSGGSFDLGRATVDVNAPLNPERTLLLRVNAAKHNEGSFLDQGVTDSWTLAPSVVYQVSDRLKLSLDLELYRREGTAPGNFRVGGGTTAHSIEDLSLDPLRSFMDNSLETESRINNIFARAEYKLTENWSSETVLAFTNSQSNLYSIYLNIFDDSLAVRSLDWQAWKVNTRQIQQNLRGEFTTGMFRNQMLAGLGVSAYDYLWPYVVTTDTVNYRDIGSDYYVGLEQYRARIAANPLSMWKEENYNYYAYASDAVHIADRFTALLGIRWDRFDERGGSDGIGEVFGLYEQDAFSPRLGLVYQVLKDRVSLYSNVMSGYRNVNGRSKIGKPFDPEHAYQGEAGIKAQAPDGRLSGTLAYYSIQVEDLVRTDPEDPNFSIQDGTQISYGVEGDVAAEPLNGLNLILGYAWNHAAMKKSDPGAEGRRQPSSGPSMAANFWATYTVPADVAKGLGLGFGGNYASRAYHQNSPDFVFTVPAYLTLDATVYFDKPSYRLGLKADNLTNERYWTPEGLQLGSPRRLVGNVTYKY